MLKSLQRALTERAPTDSFQRAAKGVRRQREVGCLWLPSRSFELRLGRHADAALEADGFFEPEWRFLRNPEWYRGWLLPFVSRFRPWTAVFLFFRGRAPPSEPCFGYARALSTTYRFFSRDLTAIPHRESKRGVKSVWKSPLSTLQTERFCHIIPTNHRFTRQIIGRFPHKSGINPYQKPQRAPPQGITKGIDKNGQKESQN